MYNANAHVLGVEWMFLFLFDPGLSPGDSAKRTNLKFAVVAFLVEADQDVVGGVRAVRDIEIKSRPAFLDNIFGLGPAIVASQCWFLQAIGEKTARFAARFGVGDGLPLARSVNFTPSFQ